MAPPMKALLLVSAFALMGAAPSLVISPAEKSAASSITQDVLRAHVRFLASDLLEGRGASSRGDRLAEEYIAAQFEMLGLKPAGTKGYLQPLELVGTTGHPDALSFAAGGKRVELKHADDFMAVAERQQEQTQMNNDPENDPNLFAGKTRLWYGRWDYKYESAAKTGAAGAIIIHTTHSAGYPWQVVRTSWAGERLELPARPGEPHLGLRMWATEDLAKCMVALGGGDLDELRRRAEKRDFRPEPLGVT